MSFLDLKISESAIQSTGVQSQPDTLTGSAADNKKVFDALPILIIRQFNLLLEALGGTGAASEVPIEPIDGMTAKNVQQALAEISKNLADYIAKIKGAGGAAEVGVSAISGMSVSNTQQALAELKRLIDNLVIGTLPPGSVTADMIADGAIVQLGALLAVAAAAAYDPEGSYAVGDYCTHGGKLHKCGTEIPDGEAWNAAHWTETTVAAELAEVRASLSNKIAVPIEILPNTDLDNVIIPGFHYCGAGLSVLNGPPNPMSETACSLLVQKTYALGIKQTLSWYFTGSSYYRTFDGESWHDWVPNATATLPREGNIPVVDGIREIGQCMYFQQQDGTTHFFVVAGAGSDGVQISNNQSFAVAPIGARPKVQYYYPAVAVSGGNTLNGYVAVNTDGTIVWVGNAVPYPGYIVSFGAFAIKKEG